MNKKYSRAKSIIIACILTRWNEEF